MTIQITEAINANVSLTFYVSKIFERNQLNLIVGTTREPFPQLENAGKFSPWHPITVNNSSAII